MAVSGQLEKSLREEVDTYINSRLRGLQEEIERIQSQINEAFTHLAERLSSESQPDSPVAVAISEYMRAAHESGVEEAAAESTGTKASSDMAILKAAIDDLDNQRSQANILTTLVNRAASFAPRVAFFVIKNEQAIGWRARGLEGTVGDEAVRDISLPLSANTPLSDVVTSRATWSGHPGASSEEHLLLGKLGGEPPQHIVAVPLVVREKTVAVLYADSDALDATAINLEALETIVRVASMAVDLLSVTRPAPVERPARVERFQAPRTAPRPATSHEDDGKRSATEVEEESRTNETASAASQSDAPQPDVEPSRAGDESAQSPSAPETSFNQATGSSTNAGFTIESDSQVDSPAPAQYSAPLGASRGYEGANASLPVDVSDEEKRLHNDARRFARLLVSEIKLYNEQKVKEGRSEGDIYERLREDIDRSRQMYDKRVAPPVAASHDYFHEELINTLAEGDASKLGGSYPGAGV